MNNVLISTQGVLVPAWLGEYELYLQEILRHLSITNWELSVLLCDEDTIQQLNSSYRGKDAPTDVLSFSMDGEEIGADGLYVAGDVIICLDFVNRNAQNFSVSFEEELRRVSIHGILHLKGLDHETNESTEPMLVLQEELLNRGAKNLGFIL